jgi:hypothetical protein
MPLPELHVKIRHYTGYVSILTQAVVGIAAFVFAFTPVADTIDVKAGLAAFGLFLIGLATFNFRRHRQVDLTEPVLTVDDLPLEQRNPYIVRTLIIWTIIWIPVSIYIAYELASVEYGWAKSVTLWSFIVMLYNNLGFWPAVLFLPAVGILLTVLAILKVRKIKALETALRIYD